MATSVLLTNLRRRIWRKEYCDLKYTVAIYLLDGRIIVRGVIQKIVGTTSNGVFGGKDT